MDDLSLDNRGILVATDKSSMHWDYLRHYEEEFHRFRDVPINVIEIGVLRGASLSLWEQYFINATIVGIDIDPSCAQYAGGRKVVAVGSQTDPQFLNDVTGKYPPTIIVDDGSHVADHVQFSFEALFPHLLSGGCYVIEDITNHTPDDFRRGAVPLDTPEYVQRIVSSVLLGRATSGMGAGLSAIVSKIDRVSTIGAATFFWKKRAVDVQSVISTKLPLVEQSGSSENWRNFAKFIVDNDGPIDQAESAIQRSLEIKPDAPLSYYWLGIIQEKKGDLAAALDSSQAASRQRPKSGLFRQRVELLEKKIRGTSPDA